MKEPDLPESYFLRDRLVSSEILARDDGFTPIDGASSTGEAGRFRGSRRFTLSVSLPFSDLSRFNQFSLTALNRSPDPLLVGMKLVHGSPEGISGPRDISFSGGREELAPGTRLHLKFPVTSFGSYGTPKGWTNIRKIEVTFGYERTHEGREDIKVCLQALEGQLVEMPHGPRLTFAGLAEVLKAEASKTLRLCRNSMAPGICFKPYGPADPGLLTPPPHPYPRESADQILNGKIMGQRMSDPIRWDANPLGVQEWTHFLNRHHFLRELVIALDQRGDEKYAEALDRITASWINDNPVPLNSNGGASPAWETLSAAWRVREWLWVRGIAWRQGSFSSETRQVMLRSIWEHARSLMDHTGHPNNWRIVESAALALAGICFPEFREAVQWTETGLQRLRTQVERQFFPDGVHYEISPLYHAICFHALLEVKLAATFRGMPFSSEFDARLEQSADYLAALCRPDFTWPSLNDSGSATGDYTALLRLAADALHRDDLLWVGTKGSTGTTPRETFRVFPDAGIATMRSHHGPDANYLVFRAGPPGAAHIHGDVLSLDVTALGIPRLVDPGITTYAPDPVSDYYRSASAHNMLLIDGRGPDRTGISFREKIRFADRDLLWTSRGSVDTATGVFRGPWEGTQEQYTVFRDVIFVKGEYWIVRDLVAGDGEHEISACWQFFPGRVKLDIETLAACTTDARGLNFMLLPILAEHSPEIEVVTGSLHPPRGWVSLEGSDLPATLCVYRMNARLPVTFVWLMLPVPGISPSRARGRLAASEGRAMRVEVIFPEQQRDILTVRSLDQTGARQSPRIEVELERIPL